MVWTAGFKPKRHVPVTREPGLQDTSYLENGQQRSPAATFWREVWTVYFFHVLLTIFYRGKYLDGSSKRME